MSDYINRMQDEHKGLRAKLYALRGFIGGKLFNELPGKKKRLMKKQLVAMETYAELLGIRIALEK